MSELINHNPDVLSCLANLSSDEVFTPPEIANAMLDMLPKELFRDPDTKFLDPACKSGVFLREIAKRLLKGLEDKFPDLQERIDHIFHKQLFGIAITELTSMLSRRSLYCSKKASSHYSVTSFDGTDGNIQFSRIEHTWDNNDRCIYCTTSRIQFDRGEELETHAYEFIHIQNIEELYNMKFDLIIGNPPYQLTDGGNGVSAKPIYQMFVQQAKKLKPRYLVMITPSRWFNGGKGLDSYREEMLNDCHLLKLVDYQNAKDCFPSTSIGGGVSYFLWSRDKEDDCEITNVKNGKEITLKRPLNEFSTFVRYNESIGIIKKVLADRRASIVNSISSRNPFGLSTNTRGRDLAFSDSLVMYSSQGKSYIEKTLVLQGLESINKWKIMISRVMSEHAGEPDKTGKYKIISSIQLLAPGEVCTDSYIIVCPHKKQEYVINCMNFLKTKFVRFLILQAISSINLSKEKYEFVPMEDFSMEQTDKGLYRKYNLTEKEIDLIESIIKPMELRGSDV